VLAQNGVEYIEEAFQACLKKAETLKSNPCIYDVQVVECHIGKPQMSY
jgi:hypothetical protein